MTAKASPETTLFAYAMEGRAYAMEERTKRGLTPAIPEEIQTLEEIQEAYCALCRRTEIDAARALAEAVFRGFERDADQDISLLMTALKRSAHAQGLCPACATRTTCDEHPGETP